MFLLRRFPPSPSPTSACDIGRAYDGTLGGDFFARAVVEVDYARQTVRLYDPSSYKYSGQGATFHLTLSAGLPVVQAKFTNQKGKLLEGDFVVSTANDDTVILFDHYAESHRILGEHWKTIPNVDPVLVGARWRCGRRAIERFSDRQLILRGASGHIFEC